MPEVLRWFEFYGLPWHEEELEGEGPNVADVKGMKSTLLLHLGVR